MLPIPSYARVTNLVNGKQVIVRVNDRGPFHSGRVIDLSYTAALKLGLLGKGSHEVEIERLLPDEIARIQARKKSEPQAPNNVMLAASGNTGSRLLALRDADARHIRELDREWRTQPIFPAPGSGLTENAEARVELLRIERTMEQGPASRPLAQVEVKPVPLPPVAEALPANVSGSAATALAALKPDSAANPAPGNPLPANPLPALAGNASGFYLQLGAYSQADNAEAERERYAHAGALPGLEVVQSGHLFRVYSGPFASRELALQAAQPFGSRVLIVQR